MAVEEHGMHESHMGHSYMRHSLRVCQCDAESPALLDAIGVESRSERCNGSQQDMKQDGRWC